MIIEIGGFPILLRTRDALFEQMLATRYQNFLNPSADPVFTFAIEVAAPKDPAPDDGVHVTRSGRLWSIRRGDLRAQADLCARCGWILQSANPYAADTLLRILHTLLLAPEGGFLLHASSAVRDDRAFLFAGVSGAGKTTIARLAPADVTPLTDEISYVRRKPEGYHAYGTPFAGDTGIRGENVSAPVAAVYFLAQGSENRIEPLPPGEAVRSLLRNILFFAEDHAMVRQVWEGAWAFVDTVPAARLTFRADPEVWELIR